MVLSLLVCPGTGFEPEIVRTLVAFFQQLFESLVALAGFRLSAAALGCLFVAMEIQFVEVGCIFGCCLALMVGSAHSCPIVSFLDATCIQASSFTAFWIIVIQVDASLYNNAGLPLKSSRLA
jgi:hypothetical protein